MKLINHALKELTWVIKDCKRFIVICALVIAIAIYSMASLNKNFAYVYNVPYSLADILCFQANKNFYPLLMVSLSVLLTIRLLRYDYELPFLIRNHSKIEIFIKQFIKICIISVFITIYIILCDFLTAIVQADCIINWNKKASIFFQQVQTVCEIEFFRVLWAFFLYSWLSMIILNMVVLLIKWLSNKDLFGWVAFFTLICIEGWSNVVLFFKIISISYHQWLSEYFELRFLYPVALLIILLLVGSIIAKRKDFLSAHQK